MAYGAAEGIARAAAPHPNVTPREPRAAGAV
jgi:hypothetical protein